MRGIQEYLTDLHDLECFYFACILDVRPKTKIHKRPALVDSATFWGKEIFDVIHFVFAVAEHLL